MSAQPLKFQHTFFPSLDGVRAIACLLVFVAHVFDYINHRTLSKGEGWVYDHFISGAGAMGVSLFFVLSGFLITHLLISEKEQFKRISLKFFYAKRVLRIWPLFFLITVTGFFIVPYLSHIPNGEAVRSHLPWFLTFTNNIDRVHTGFSGIGNDSLGVLWSVAVEEQFYLLWPLVILLAGKKLFPYLALAVVAGSCVFRFLHSGNDAAVFYHSLSVCGDLAVGGIVGWLAFYSEKFRTVFRTMREPTRVGLYLFILLVSIFHMKLLIEPALLVPGRVVLAVAFGLLIADQSYGPPNLFSATNFPRLRWLGTISYGIYCYHLFVVMIFQKINSTFISGKISTFVFYSELSGIFLLTILISYLSHRYFESFFMKMRSRFRPSYIS